MKALLALAIFMILLTAVSVAAKADDDGTGTASVTSEKPAQSIGSEAPAPSAQAAPEPQAAPEEPATPPAQADTTVSKPQTQAPKAKAQTQAAPSMESLHPSGRGKSLDFEDNVVEGMNRNPLDSLENISKKDGRDQSHLYRKRTDFRKEMKSTIQEGGYTP
jgi:hypothetical protein